VRLCFPVEVVLHLGVVVDVIKAGLVGLRIRYGVIPYDDAWRLHEARLDRVIQPEVARPAREPPSAIGNRWPAGRVRSSQIVGEAGIGKSRLVQRFREEISATPYTWLECATAPFFRVGAARGVYQSDRRQPATVLS
jgi:hypothetical protein